MASIIGSTRETVTVVLGHLQTEGSIVIARRRITIRNLRKLASEVKEPVPQLKRQLKNARPPIAVGVPRTA